MFSDEFYQINTCNINQRYERHLDTNDINIMPDYAIEVFASGLDSPSSLVFTDDGNLIISESGITSGNPRILQLINNQFVTIAEDFFIPITGVNYLNGVIYVSHRGSISRINLDRTRQNIVMGLPSNGDYINSNIVFGPDNKIYFGQGTMTNAGVVGDDNEWVKAAPFLCDYSGDYIMLNGQNFPSANILSEVRDAEKVLTGAFSPYGLSNTAFETRKRYEKASGSILRCNLDGTELEQLAWGFRNPVSMRFNQEGTLYISNNGYENRGSRPISNANDHIYIFNQGVWYGWPDFNGTDPLTLAKYKPEGGPQPELLLKNHPNIPPTPYASFPTNTNIRGFDFSYNTNFSNTIDLYIAEYGSTDFSRTNISYSGAGHKISKVDAMTRNITTFASNKSGYPSSISQEGGFERLSDLMFGPDGALYVLDLGINDRYNPRVYLPNTGVIWRIYKTT